MVPGPSTPILDVQRFSTWKLGQEQLFLSEERAKDRWNRWVEWVKLWGLSKMYEVNYLIQQKS